MKRLERIRSLGPALGPEYSRVHTGGTPDSPATAEELRRFEVVLQGKVCTVQAHEDGARLRVWREWLGEAWSTSQGAVYRYLNDESFTPPVTFLTRPDGTATANLREMGSLLQDALWPVNRMHAAAPEPDPVEFLRRYSHHVRRLLMLASPLTAAACAERSRGCAGRHWGWMATAW